MGTQVEPFLLLEPEVAPRLEPLPAVLPLPAPPARRIRLPSALLGAAVLALSPREAKLLSWRRRQKSRSPGRARSKP